MNSEASLCRSCHAPIRWVVSGSTGKRMPVDAEPSSKGNLYIGEKGGRPTAWIMSIGLERNRLQAEGRAYISHFATCPQHRKWRKKGS
jgi:hypothetical protein